MMIASLAKCSLCFQLSLSLGKCHKPVSERQEKVELVSEQHSEEEKTDQYLFQGEGNGKPLL